MSEEATTLLLQMLKEQSRQIDKLETKVDELIAIKNKLIAGGLIFSAILGFLWDWFRDFFGRN